MKTLFIAGGSASGKSTLAQLVQAEVARSAVLHQDSFYRDRPEGSGAGDRHHFDFDVPGSIHWAEMARALEALQAGLTTDVPTYDFSVSRRSGQTCFEPPQTLLIVDGTLVLHAPELVSLRDHAVFVRADEPLRRARRERRDVEERGRDLDDVRRQLADQVFPAHDRYVEPSAARADRVLEADAIMDDPQAAVGAVLALCGLPR